MVVGCCFVSYVLMLLSNYKSQYLEHSLIHITEASCSLQEALRLAAKFSLYLYRGMNKEKKYSDTFENIKKDFIENYCNRDIVIGEKD